MDEESSAGDCQTHPQLVPLLSGGTGLVCGPVTWWGYLTSTGMEGAKNKEKKKRSKGRRKGQEEGSRLGYKSLPRWPKSRAVEQDLKFLISRKFRLKAPYLFPLLFCTFLLIPPLCLSACLSLFLFPSHPIHSTFHFLLSLSIPPLSFPRKFSYSPLTRLFFICLLLSPPLHSSLFSFLFPSLFRFLLFSTFPLALYFHLQDLYRCKKTPPASGAFGSRNSISCSTMTLIWLRNLMFIEHFILSDHPRSWWRLSCWHVSVTALMCRRLVPYLGDDSAGANSWCHFPGCGL